MQAGDASARLNEFKLLYAAETRFVDHLVGQVVEAMPERATIIVTADHGESLDEHDYFFNHGATLWEQSMHIPMMVRGPGFEGGKKIDALTGVVDVAPTLLGVAGLAPASQGLRGLVDGTRHLDSVLAYTTGQEARGDSPLMRAGKHRARGQRDAAGNRLLGGEKKEQLAAVRLAGKKLIGGPREPSYSICCRSGEATPLPVPEELSKEKDRLKEICRGPSTGRATRSSSSYTRSATSSSRLRDRRRDPAQWRSAPRPGDRRPRAHCWRGRAPGP